MNNASCVRDTERQVLLHLGHSKAHPPALGTPLWLFQVLLFAHVGSGMVLVLHLLHGDLVSAALL